LAKPIFIEDHGTDEAYPGGDRGLDALAGVIKHLTRANAIGMLRGIQEAAYRAGYEAAMKKRLRKTKEGDI